MTVKETISVWLKAARAPFLIVSFIPAVLGGIIAYYNGFFDWSIFILATVGIVMAHSAGDFVDDYFDYINGNLGNKEQQFHDSPLISGKVTLRQVLIATVICLAIAAGIGVYLLFEIGMPVLYLMLAGIFIVLFYTSPPVRLNYRGLGETALFFAFGPMIVVGVYYVLTGTITWEPVFASLPLGIFTMNVGIVSNTFDYEDDVKNGKRCIPVRFGQAFAVRLIITGTVVAYLSIAAGVLLGFMPTWTLISLATIPLAAGVIIKTNKYNDTSNYTSAMGMAIGLTTIMGLMIVGGYLI
jgi:1,4-dihydroxy-2-naphthoate polyprenyltransferase